MADRQPWSILNAWSTGLSFVSQIMCCEMYWRLLICNTFRSPACHETSPETMGYLYPVWSTLTELSAGRPFVANQSSCPFLSSKMPRPCSHSIQCDQTTTKKIRGYQRIGVQSGTNQKWSKFARVAGAERLCIRGKVWKIPRADEWLRGVYAPRHSSTWNWFRIRLFMRGGYWFDWGNRLVLDSWSQWYCCFGH